MNISVRITTTASTLATSLFAGSALADGPAPDLQVGGRDGWVTVTASDIVTVTAGLDAGDWEGEEVELWLVAGTSRGTFSYILDTGWVAGVEPGWRGPVSSFDSFDIWLNTLPFGTGEYWIGFAVDDDVNGLLDTIWVDLAAIEVHPTPGWERAIGGIGGQAGTAVLETVDGGYVIAGWTGIAGDRDPYVVNTDAEGEVLWTKTLVLPGDGYATSIQQTGDGGYVISGTAEPGGPETDDVFLAKLDAQGEPLWTRFYGGDQWDWGASVQRTPDGGYVLGGTTFSFGAGGPDFFLMKTDSIGEMLWFRTYGGGSSEYCGALEPTADGGYVLAGDSFSFGAGAADVYLVRTDARGQALWERVFGGEASEDGYSVIQTTDGGYLMAGRTSSFGGGFDDPYLVRTNAEGELIWAKAFGGSEYDGANSVIETADGRYVLAGSTDSFDGGDIYLIGVDSAE